MSKPSTAELAYQNVKDFIRQERRMRQYVFRNDAEKMRIKVTQCDDALASLEILRSAATPAQTEQPTPYRQGGLL